MSIESNLLRVSITMTNYSSSSINTKTENTVTFVNNNLQSGFMKIAVEADADTSWLASRKEKITDTLSNWLEEQTLSAIELQIKTHDGYVFESYRFDVSYDGNMSYVQFDGKNVMCEVGDYSHRDDVIAKIVPYTYVNNTNIYNYSKGPDIKTKSITSFGHGDISVDTQKVLNPNRHGDAGNKNNSSEGVFGKILSAVFD